MPPYIPEQEETGSNDGRINDNSVFLAGPPGDFDNIYQYDPLGWVGHVGTGVSDTCYAANVFQIRSSEMLTGVGIYTPQVNSRYRLLVYRNPDQGPVNSSGPVAQQSGTIANPGYHVLTLDTPFRLQKGENILIALQIQSPGFNFPIAVEYAVYKVPMRPVPARAG